MHATLSNGKTALVRAPFQPEARRALVAGERLVIARQHRFIDPMTNGWFLGIFSMFLIEATFLSLSPHLRTHLIAFIMVNPHQLMLTPLQWSILGYPLILGAVFIFSINFYRVHGNHQVIIADDWGISVQFPRQPSRSIPWHEIRIFAAVDERYFLLGTAHTLLFTVVNQDDEKSKDPRLAYYKDDVRCLLATITTRASVPLHSGAGYLNPVNVATFYTGEEMSAFLPVDEPWQPVATIDTILTTKQGLLPKLKVGIPPKILFVWAFRWSMLVPVGYALIFVLYGAISRDGILYFITSTLGFWLIFIPLIALMRLQYLRNNNPTVVAEEDKLALYGYNNRVIASIRWEDIAAWGVARPTADIRDMAAYAAVSRNGMQRVGWFESSDSKLDEFSLEYESNIAYRAAAEQLHAYIAHRTGLNLCEVPNGRD